MELVGFRKQAFSCLSLSVSPEMIRILTLMISFAYLVFSSFSNMFYGILIRRKQTKIIREINFEKIQMHDCNLYPQQQESTERGSTKVFSLYIAVSFITISWR